MLLTLFLKVGYMVYMHTYEVVEYESSIDLMDISELKRLGWLGHELISVEKLQKQDGSHFIYTFHKHKRYKNKKYNYMEVIIFHPMYPEDKKWFESEGWKLLASLQYVRHKDSAIIINGEIESLICVCLIFYFIKEIKPTIRQKK